MNNLPIPVQSNEREIFLDILRGFAIFGIFIANLKTFTFYNDDLSASTWMIQPNWDHTMGFWHDMFIEGKFYSIFSLLFGWGLSLQISRAESKGIVVLPTIRRRLVFMMILGLAHLLLWQGDIVLFYALLGFILIPLRKLSNTKLLITGCILTFVPILVYGLKMKWQWANLPAECFHKIGDKIASKTIGSFASEIDYLDFIKNANWSDYFKSNLSNIFYRYEYLFFVSRIFKVLGMMCIGYALGRSGFYQNFKTNKKTVAWIVVLGLVLGLPANYFLAYYMAHFSGDYWTLKINGLYQTIAYAFGVMPLALAYVGLFMFGFDTTFGQKTLSILAPVGKMAFSNYILQSLIGCFVFLGAGLGYREKIGPFYYTIFGIIVFTFQIIISTIWLHYFNYGPLEWLWRSATYKKWQPLKK